MTKKMEIPTENTRTSSNLAAIHSGHMRLAEDAVRFDLLPHQRAAAWHIIAAEGDYPQYKTSSLIYADKLGAGKTRVALAVAVVKPFPAVAMPERIGDHIIEANDAPYLFQNLFIVANDVFDHWQEEIRMCNISAVTINNRAELAEYITNHRTCGEDVVLIRLSKSTKLCEHLAHAIKIPYARVFVDDYDHALESIIPRGISYIGISSTHSKGGGLYYRAESPFDMRRKSTISSPIIVRCTDEFIEQSTRLPAYLYYKIQIESPNALAYSLKGISAFTELLEVLSSDSHERVEQMLGATIRSPADLYRAMMGKVYEKCAAAEAAAARLTKLNAEVTAIARAEGVNADLTAEYETEVRAHVFDGAPITPKAQRGYSALAKAVGSEVSTRQLETANDVATARAAIAQNICEVCRGEIGGDLNAIIVRCCNKIACIVCAETTWTRWKRTICPFNATHTLSRDDIVHISGKISLIEIADAAITDGGATPVIAPVAEPEAKKTTKIDICISIILGEQCGKQSKPDWPNLLQGDVVVPNDAPRKVIIFSREDESLATIKGALVAAGINVFHVRGSTQEIRNILRKCRQTTEPLAVLINNQSHIHGYNAQFATDLIFYHYINDESVRSQLAGRIQRLGRVGSARIWQLRYNGE
jgi:hypothetical protein